MQVIQSLNEKLENLRNEEDKLKESLQLEYNKLFEQDKVLQQDIQDALNITQSFDLNEQGEVISYYRTKTDLSAKHSEHEYLQSYLQDVHGLGVDFKNSVLTQWQGPSIIIYDNGEVYDQDSCVWIVKHDSYESIEERNSLIEAYMSRTGHYPSVFKVDRYNNVSLVNTKNREV